MATGKKPASNAGKILRNPKSTKKEKEVAASDLVQRKPGKSSPKKGKYVESSAAGAVAVKQLMLVAPFAMSLLPPIAALALAPQHAVPPGMNRPGDKVVE